jgi:hypothetical protein
MIYHNGTMPLIYGLERSSFFIEDMVVACSAVSRFGVRFLKVKLGVNKGI